jgi:hypothetical protein
LAFPVVLQYLAVPFSIEEWPAENEVIENGTCTEDITDRTHFGMTDVFDR